MPFWQTQYPDLKTGQIFVFDWRPSNFTVSQHWLNLEKSWVCSLIRVLRVENCHFWNFVNTSSLSWDIGLLAWTPMKNENKTSFQIGLSRSSKWHLRFFWRIFLRLDSFLACSVWVDINVNVSFNENVRQFSVRFIKLLHHCIRMSSLRQVESVIGFDCTLQQKWQKSNFISGRFLSQVFFSFLCNAEKS